MNGAGWWYQSDEAERERARRDDGPPPPIVGRWLAALAAMPYVTTIEYGERRVGLVHSGGRDRHLDPLVAPVRVDRERVRGQRCP